MMTTKLEKHLIVALVLVIVLVPLLCAFIVFILASTRTTVCVTQECLQSALTLSKNMDLTVDPCDDFYMFACGNYIRHNFIPDDKVEIDSISVVQDLVSEKLRILLEEPIAEHEINPFKYAKTHYKTCLNKSEDNSQVLLDVLSNLGGWPVLERIWFDRAFDWREFAHQMRQAGLHSESFITLNVDVMMNDSSKRILEIDEPSIMYKEYFKNGIDDPISKAYYDLMVDIVVILGASRSHAQTEMFKVMNLIINLSKLYNHYINASNVDCLISNIKISIPKEEQRSMKNLLNIMTLENVQTLFPIVDWPSYINNQLLNTSNYDENSTVNVLYPHQLRKINSIILHNDERTLANYMIWMAISQEIQYINEELRIRNLQFMKLADGNSEVKPRWQECVEEISDSWPKVASALYVRKFLNPRTKDTIEILVTSIKEELLRTLRTIDWMDAASQDLAISKANHITTFAGYANELLDDRKLEEYYSNLEISFENSLTIGLKLNKFAIIEDYKLLPEPVNKTDWRLQHSSVYINAFYEAASNSIHFPAGILQANFLGYNRPKYLNYGGIGLIIGHELTHGFDDRGSQFDEDGNVSEWWNAKTKHAFLEKAKCIVEQYGNITVSEVGLNLHGGQTQGENIADNGGIIEAYLAYRRWVSGNGPEPILPGFINYTNKQMFWLSTASTWCTKTRPEQLRYQILSDEHVPSPYRINIPFANSEYFSQDFNCPLGSRMNPVHKCKVW